MTPEKQEIEKLTAKVSEYRKENAELRNTVRAKGYSFDLIEERNELERLLVTAQATIQVLSKKLADCSHLTEHFTVKD